MNFLLLNNLYFWFIGFLKLILTLPNATISIKNIFLYNENSEDNSTKSNEILFSYDFLIYF